MTYRRLLARRLTPAGPRQPSFFTHQVLDRYMTCAVNLEGQDGLCDAGRERCLRDVTCQWARLHLRKLMAQSSVHLHLHLSTQTFISKADNSKEHPASQREESRSRVDRKIKRATGRSSEVWRLVCLIVCQLAGLLGKRLHAKPPSVAS